MISLYSLYFITALGLGWIISKNGLFQGGTYGILIYATFLGTMFTFAGMTAAVLFASVFVAMEVIRLIRGRGTLTSPSFLDTLIISFVLWTLLSTAFHSAPLNLIRQPIIMALILAAAKIRTTDYDQVTKAIFDALLTGGVVVALTILIQFFISPSLFGRVELIRSEEYLLANSYFRPGGFHGNPNSAALYLLFAFGGVLVDLASHQRRITQIVGRIAILSLIIYALYLLQSRSAMLGAILMFGFWVYTNARIQLRFFFIVISGLFSLLILLSRSFFDLVWTFLFPSRGGLEDGLGREERWDIALHIAQTSPLFGDSTHLFAGKLINYHNDFLGVASYYGIPALFLFCLVLGICIYAAYNRNKLVSEDTRLAKWVLLVMPGLVLHALFHQVLLGGICFWFILGAVYNQHLRHSRRKTKPSQLPTG